MLARALLWLLAVAAGSPWILQWAMAQAPSSAPADDGLPCPHLERAASRTVTRVIDGETVALDDGAELRLAGALAPRALDAVAEPGQWPMEMAAIEELRALLVGRSIEIAFGGERTDRYGRLQAQAFWHEAGRRYWAQGHMLQQGLARAYVLAGSRACAAELLAAEHTAREAGRGLWREAAYQVRPANDASALARYRATFQVVEGVVVRVAEVRDVIYLNFEVDWRQGFSVSLRRADRNLLGDYAARPKALQGRTVRVRGWLEAKPAPTIDLSSAGLIELVDSAGVAADAADRPPDPGTSRRSRRRAGSTEAPQPAAPDPPSPAPKAEPPSLIEAGR